MNTAVLYAGLIAATGLERLAELVVARRNAAWSFERGGVEFGQGHYPFMVFLHTGFLLGCVAEVWLLGRTFIPTLGVPMLALALGCQALRWWCITTLGARWNTRVIIVPGLAPITHGPYRFFRHPNYVAVVLEGIALPLVHSAWITALVFTILNAGLMVVRITTENRALDSLPEPEPRS